MICTTLGRRRSSAEANFTIAISPPDTANSKVVFVAEIWYVRIDIISLLNQLYYCTPSSLLFTAYKTNVQPNLLSAVLQLTTSHSNSDFTNGEIVAKRHIPQVLTTRGTLKSARQLNGALRVNVTLQFNT